MTETGLFFGSFNPIHTGHLIIASYMAQYTHLKEVWFVVSPQNPFKDKKSLANQYDRLEMVNLAAEGSPLLGICDIEFNMPQPSYTIDTLARLREKYPARRFTLIMGSDNLQGIMKWKNAEVLLRDYPILVYPRTGYTNTAMPQAGDVRITGAPQVEIASTFIRKAIKEGKNIQYLVPENVIQFIEAKGLYL